eukprot:gb/GEZN01021958.1/.p1 GENE.gb/GEZN01021958.1/~~gb/GEZN01021958.1/.p1  ORF type:complete len:123 (+),score=11.63 gb/GEZN01021958.1/:151-519(+)
MRRSLMRLFQKPVKQDMAPPGGFKLTPYVRHDMIHKGFRGYQTLILALAGFTYGGYVMLTGEAQKQREQRFIDTDLRMDILELYPRKYKESAYYLQKVDDEVRQKALDRAAAAPAEPEPAAK